MAETMAHPSSQPTTVGPTEGPSSNESSASSTASPSASSRAPAPAAVRPFDPHTVRLDFPILATTSHGRPLVYLDSAATSQKPTVVIEAVDRFYRADNANVHRGIYELGERATALYEGAREKVARFIGAPDSQELVF
ncbi:MAG: aminotransferase class V-fold PLP-dependent enzyme, partial [Candidatus Limnocylindrales bacterium]